LSGARKIRGAFGACIAAQKAIGAFPACMPVWSVYSGSKRYVGKVWGLHVRLELVYKCLSGVGATSSRGQCASRLLRGVWSLYSGPKRYMRKACGLHVRLQVACQCWRSARKVGGALGACLAAQLSLPSLISNSISQSGVFENLLRGWCILARPHNCWRRAPVGITRARTRFDPGSNPGWRCLAFFSLCVGKASMGLQFG